MELKHTLGTKIKTFFEKPKNTRGTSVGLTLLAAYTAGYGTAKTARCGLLAETKANIHGVFTAGTFTAFAINTINVIKTEDKKNKYSFIKLGLYTSSAALAYIAGLSHGALEDII